MPVICLDHEDLIESTEGYHPVASDEGRHAFGDLDLASCPPILGYNQVRLKPPATPLLTLAETGDPLLVSHAAGQGRVVCYMSDPAPHWACNLVFWPHYADFWLRCLDLALGRR
jgi:uncharacterized membrane protein